MKTTAFAAALAVAVAVFLPARAAAQQPGHLAKDINPGVTAEDGVSPQNLVTFNGAVYYQGYDDYHGRALWRSDGSPQGTRMVVDFVPGWNSDHFTLVSRREGLIILHPSGDIWTSDGTAANTRRAATIEGLSNAGQSVAVGSLVFFVGHSNTQGWVLARTDGTPQGSFIIRSLPPWGWKTVAAANLLYFQTGADQWWRSDGTATGTFPVASTGISFLSGAAIGDSLFFTKCEPTHGCELWRTDGTAESTRLVVDLESGPNSSTPYALSSVGSALYFGTRFPRGVWTSDGSAGGTTRVATALSVTETPHQMTPAFAGAGAAAIFVGVNDDGTGFWRTDGTTAGTRMLAAVTSADQYVSDLSLLGDSTAAYATLARWTSTGEGFREVWRVTDAIAQRLDRTDASALWYDHNLAVAGGRAFYSSIDIGSGHELWIADATGTRMVVDTAPASNSWPYMMTAAGSSVFFMADANHDPVTPSYGELWTSDGSGTGTTMVKDLTPGLDSTSINDIVAVPGRVFFRRATWYQSELWTSDGTPAGTVRLADSVHGDFGAAGSQLFFSRFDGSSWSLWKSDGTDAGTVPVRRLPAWASIGGFQAVGPLVYFTACTNDLGCEPWVTDGTEAGTRLLQDLAQGRASSYPREFTAWNGGAVFFAVGIQQLWKTDGTPEGTVLIRDVGTYSTYGLTALEDRLVFALVRPSQPNGRNELWITDGTAAGTTLVREMELRDYGANMYGFARIGDLILFTAEDAEHGREVWRTDGTTEGTTMVVDLAPGRDDGVQVGNFSLFAVSGLRAVFAGMTREHGTEVFVTDGTAAGTRLLTDINPGPEPSNPYEMVVAGANLFVAAGRPDVGYELWTVVLSPAGALDDLAQDLDAMALPQAVRQSLKAKLQAAAKALERGDGTAVNLLQAFIYQIEALAGSKIPQADAAALIEAARRIMESLG